MSQEDGVEDFEKLGKQFVSTLFDFYKLWRDEKKRLSEQQAQQKEAADIREAQQKFTAEQNQKLLDGIKDALKEAGVTPTDDNVKLAQKELDRLAEIEDRELEIKAEIDDIDNRLDAIDLEQDAILNPKLEGQELADYQPDVDRLRELNNERNGLKNKKSELGKELDGLATEKADITNGKGLKQLSVGGNSQSIGGLDPGTSLDPDPTTVVRNQTADRLRRVNERIAELDEQQDILKKVPANQRTPDDDSAMLDMQREKVSLQAQKTQLESQLKTSKVGGPGNPLDPSKKLDGVNSRIGELQQQQNALKQVPGSQRTPDDDRAMLEMQKEKTGLQTQQSQLEGQPGQGRGVPQDPAKQLEGVNDRIGELQQQQEMLNKVPVNERTPDDDRAMLEMQKEKTGLQTQKSQLEAQLDGGQSKGLGLQQDPAKRLQALDTRIGELEEQQGILNKVPLNERTPDDDLALLEMQKEKTGLQTQKANLGVELPDEGLSMPGMGEEGLQGPVQSRPQKLEPKAGFVGKDQGSPGVGRPRAQSLDGLQTEGFGPGVTDLENRQFRSKSVGDTLQKQGYFKGRSQKNALALKQGPGFKA